MFWKTNTVKTKKTNSVRTKKTIQHQEQMFLKMTLNHKTNVHSRGTQVEVGELESQPLPETFDIKMEENQDDSFSLLAS